MSRLYHGGYAFYEQEKAIRREHHVQRYLRQQREIKQTERFVERFRSKASKASLVQSRVKMLDRLEEVAPLERGGEAGKDALPCS